MTLTEANRTETNDQIDELLGWLEGNWDPDLTVGDWWERLGLSGWAAPMLPASSAWMFSSISARQTGQCWCLR